MSIEDTKHTYWITLLKAMHNLYRPVNADEVRLNFAVNNEVNQGIIVQLTAPFRLLNDMQGSCDITTATAAEWNNKQTSKINQFSI